MPTPPERSLVRLLIVPISVAAIAGVGFSFSPELGILLRLIGILVCAVWAIVIGVMAANAAWRANWRKCLALAAILIGVWPIVAVVALRGGDYVHLAVMWPSYRAKIQAANGGPVAVSWGLVGTVIASTERTLVYDPLDHEPGRVDGLGSESSIWNRHYGRETRHYRLIGHFYVLEEDM